MTETPLPPANDPTGAPVSATTASPFAYGASATVAGYTGPAADESDKSTASLAHFLSILGFIPPLIIMLIKKDRPFVADQSKEALNWEITVILALIATIILTVILSQIHGVLALVGMLAYFAIIAANIVLCVMGGLAAKKGVAHRYPFALRLIK